MLHTSRTLALVGGEQRVRLKIVLRGATVGGWWPAEQWFQTARKASMTPHANDDEKGTNQRLIYCIFSCTMQLSLKVTIQCVPGYPSATGMVSAWTTFHC